MSELIEALTAVAEPRPPGAGRSTTSDLSIDEILLLHAAGWEPVALVFGVSCWSIPWGSLGTWQGQVGEVREATEAFRGAFEEASYQLRRETDRLGGFGVVGVEIELRMRAQHVDLALTGTAVRSLGANPAATNFQSDLSARDFVLLLRAGWVPLDLVAGASFVIAPRRSARQWAAQQGRNVELTNLTQALYHAREVAMEQMQAGARRLEAAGVVNVKLHEGPLGYSHRVVQFVALGTAVRLGEEGHQHIAPTMVVSLDEQVRLFEATSLRTPGTKRG